MALTSEQKSSLKFVENHCKESDDKFSQSIDLVLSQSNIDKIWYEQAVDKIRTHATIALHFHPDRLTPNGLTVAHSLYLTGEYKNQFEVGISSGSVSARKGGDRDIWEEKLFGEFYHSSKVIGNDRPKYGSLNLTLTEDGPSPRFGSCYFLLKPEIKDRSTFTYGDSHTMPRDIGTINHFNMIMQALLNDLFTRNEALGIKDTEVLSFLTFVAFNIGDTDFKNRNSFSRNLDFYIESQIHGDISLYRDITTLVADYSFRETEVELNFQKLCSKFSIDFYWHSGFQMKETDFPANFRGPKIPEMAKRIAQRGMVNAYLIGLASNRIITEPDLWNDLGSKEELLQLVKYMWHCLVKFGEPINKASH